MHLKEEKLKELLIDSGLIDESIFASASEEATRSGQSTVSVLLGRDVVTDDYLAEILSPYFGVPIINLKKVIIKSDDLLLLPENFAKSNNVVVFQYDPQEKLVKLAMVDPLDYDTIEYIRAKLDCWTDVYLTTGASLKYGLKQYNKSLGADFNQIIESNLKESYSLVSGEADVSKMAESVPIASILDSIIENAATSGASDIHFEPLKKKLLIRYRVDGVMQEILSLADVIAPVLTARVKILANMQIDEHRIPQDGRFHFEIDDGGRIDIRVNVMPVLNGEKVEMRLLKSSAKPLSLSELGLSEADQAFVNEEIKKPHGMILVTGPTGHGKTTTLYSILHILNTPKVNITTIEDPIEYEVGRINQTQVNSRAGITFANGLRSLMRQNPDIIMIGEIRDNETVEIAVQAALTGHLLLSSLHTNDAPSAIPRLLDMGAQAFLLSSTLNLVIAQRLVRKICMSCIETYQVQPRVKKTITDQLALAGNNDKGKGKGKGKVPATFYRGKGCHVCGGSGFNGQVAIFEIMKITEELRKIITANKSLGDLRRQAIADGMVPMFEDGLDKVEKGITTIDEVLRVVKE